MVSPLRIITITQCEFCALISFCPHVFCCNFCHSFRSRFSLIVICLTVCERIRQSVCVCEWVCKSVMWNERRSSRRSNAKKKPNTLLSVRANQKICFNWIVNLTVIEFSQHRVDYGRDPVSYGFHLPFWIASSPSCYECSSDLLSSIFLCIFRTFSTHIWSLCSLPLYLSLVHSYYFISSHLISVLPFWLLWVYFFIII